MPTDIYFAGENLRVTVEEEPSQVAEAFASAHGLPCRLTSFGGQGEVYINPSTVAFWSASELSRLPAPSQEPTEHTTGRQAVTDIWGRPLRGKTPR